MTSTYQVNLGRLRWLPTIFACWSQACVREGVSRLRPGALLVLLAGLLGVLRHGLFAVVSFEPYKSGG